MGRFVTAALIGALVAAGWAAVADVRAAATLGARKVALSGCLVRGEHGDGYFLTSVGRAPARLRPDDRVARGPVGASGAALTTVYRLTDHDDLSAHVGHRVEVDGDLHATSSDGTEGRRVLVRRVDVDGVRMLAATCQ